jgi:hypothetical protein
MELGEPDAKGRRKPRPIPDSGCPADQREEQTHASRGEAQQNAHEYGDRHFQAKPEQSGHDMAFLDLAQPRQDDSQERRAFIFRTENFFI